MDLNANIVLAEKRFGKKNMYTIQNRIGIYWYYWNVDSYLTISKDVLYSFTIPLKNAIYV